MKNTQVKSQPQVPVYVDEKVLLQEEQYLYDAPAERGFIACLMAKPELLAEAEPVVSQDMIFFPLHNYIYQVMKFVAKKAAQNGWSVQFDEFTVMSVAKEMGQAYVDSFLRKTDGMAKWNELKETAAFADLTNFGSYMATLKDRAARVKFFRMARQMQLSVMNMQTNPDVGQVAAEFEGQISDITFGAARGDSRLTRLGEYENEFMTFAGLAHKYPNEHIFHLRHPRFHYWMDLMGGGFVRNSLTIVAARPKVGKSTMLLDICIDFALMGIPVLFLDTEMSGMEMFSRQLSNLTMIHEHVLRKGRFFDGVNHQHEMALVQEKLEMMRGAPLFYASVAGKPVEFGISMTRQFHSRNVGTKQLEWNGKMHTFSKPCLVVYDWLKLPSGSSADANAKEYQLLGELCMSLKDTAKHLNIPMVCGAQQNRNNVGKDDREAIENAEASLSGSDRLAMFCSSLCILRNPSLAMQEAISTNWPAAREGRKGQQSWPFNQVFQVIFNRNGNEFRTGIPMYIDRGHSKYEEMAYTDEVYAAMAAGQQPQQKKESMYLEFLREFVQAKAYAKAGQGGAAGGKVVKVPTQAPLKVAS
jgi:replicative DNA helicase